MNFSCRQYLQLGKVYFDREQMIFGQIWVSVYIKYTVTVQFIFWQIWFCYDWSDDIVRLQTCTLAYLASGWMALPWQCEKWCISCFLLTKLREGFPTHYAGVCLVLPALHISTGNWTGSPKVHNGDLSLQFSNQHIDCSVDTQLNTITQSMLPDIDKIVRGRANLSLMSHE